MNRVILMGRLTRDPEVRYSNGERAMAITRYTLAVDRRGRRSQNGGDQQQTGGDFTEGRKKFHDGVPFCDAFPDIRSRVLQYLSF